MVSLDNTNVQGATGARIDGPIGSPATGAWTVQGASGAYPQAVTLTSTTITGSVVIAGNLTHDNAAPTSDQIGVIPAIANAAAPTYTEGDQGLLSTNLVGDLRVNQSGTFKTYSSTVAGNVQNVITTGAGKKWILLSVSIIVATNGTAGTRTPSCYVEDSSARVMCNINAGVGATTISSSFYYTFGPGLPLSTVITSSCATVPLPKFALGTGSTVNGNVTGGLAGDSSIMTICVMEFNA